jgi:hypothetical protein
MLAPYEVVLVLHHWVSCCSLSPTPLSLSLSLLSFSQAAQIDGFSEEVADLRTSYSKANNTAGDEAKAAAKANFYATDLPKYLAALEVCRH